MYCTRPQRPAGLRLHLISTVALLFSALLTSTPATAKKTTQSSHAATAHGQQRSLDLSFQGYPQARHLPHSLMSSQRSLHASRQSAVKPGQPYQVLPQPAQIAPTGKQGLPERSDHIPERKLLPYRVERASGLFSESNGLRGFMAHNWLNQTLGLQGGMALRQEQYREEDSTLRDNMAVGLGFLLAF